LLLEIFQYHNDQVKALVGKEYSTGTLTKFTTVLNHTRIFLRWKYKDRVLPILSNQKMNAYLKEIADCCGITKRLTFHIARHTFATTITLSNGVPIETVSKMLGHRNLKTTQHYAKILNRKVSQDMQALKEKLLVKSITPHVEAQQQTI
jgi:site-specific recombinase XerD